MKKLILFTLTALLALALSIELSSRAFYSSQMNTYEKAIHSIDSLKQSCRTSKQDPGILFSRYIDQQLIPFWIGTPWDFNGTTQIPGKGYIACGYFVTTVLRDAGVNLNRVKLAQQASETMIKSLTKTVEHYPNCSFAEFIQKIKAKGVGLSIIGLDNHTGFLYYDGKELYFIHSSYVGTGRVAKEVASSNAILQYSNYKVVGFISRDKAFIKRWLAQ